MVLDPEKKPYMYQGVDWAYDIKTSERRDDTFYRCLKFMGFFSNHIAHFYSSFTWRCCNIYDLVYVTFSLTCICWVKMEIHFYSAICEYKGFQR